MGAALGVLNKLKEQQAAKAAPPAAVEMTPEEAEAAYVAELEGACVARARGMRARSVALTRALPWLLFHREALRLEVAARTPPQAPSIVKFAPTDTQIPTVDSLFRLLTAPSGTLCDIGDSIDKAIGGLLAACHDKKTVKDILQFFFEQLKTMPQPPKISFSLSEDNQPSLDIDFTGARLTPILQVICDALMALVAAIKALVDQGPAILQQVKDLIGKCKEITPAQLKEDAKGAGLKAMDALKSVKTFGANSKLAAGIPGNFKELFDKCVDILKSLKGAAK